jgi:type I restriction enzyme, S subunit
VLGGVPVGEVARIQSGYAFKSEWFSAGGIRLLRNANVSQRKVIWEDVARLPESRRAEFPSYELREGDIVLSLDRPVVAGGLKIARLTAQDIPCLLLQRVGRFVLSDRIVPDYLYLFLQTQPVIEAITAHDQSLGVPHVSPKQVERLSIALPPIAEQKRLAAHVERQLMEVESVVHAVECKLAAIEALPGRILAGCFGGGANGVAEGAG